MRRKRRLRRIADLEAVLGIWPPWHFVREPWSDMNGSSGFTYRLPREGDTGHAVAWSEVGNIRADLGSLMSPLPYRDEHEALEAFIRRRQIRA